MPNVLIVDDEVLLRALVCEILSVIPNIVLFEAEDGMAALEQARRHLPRLVISDIRLPKMNGFELCRVIRSDPALASISVILFTAATDLSDERFAKLVGADGFLRKPFEETALLGMVLQMLQGHTPWPV